MVRIVRVDFLAWELVGAAVFFLANRSLSDLKTFVRRVIFDHRIPLDLDIAPLRFKNLPLL